MKFSIFVLRHNRYLLFILLQTFNLQLLTFNSFAQGIGINNDGAEPAKR